MTEYYDFASEEKENEMPWTDHWKETNHVDWSCTVCNRQNEYSTTYCSGCGKIAPADANQRIEDVAATMIQCLVREHQAFGVLKAKAVMIYVKRLDKTSGEEFFENSVTHGTSWVLPSFITPDELDDNDDYLETQAWIVKEKTRAEDRERARVELTAERKEKTDAEKEKNDAKAAVDLAEIWDPILEAAREKKEVMACWKGIDRVPEEVLALGADMLKLRLVGNPLGSVPDNLAIRMPNLVVLSLSTCGLTAISDNICTLIQLTELNLIKNKLKALPKDIGNLTKLTDLFVSSNQLLELPQSINKLDKLKKLDLERNRIKFLPHDIVEMKTTIMSWSSLRLRSLPGNIGLFDCLTSLTANHNRIRVIPYSIGQLQNLEHLSLCDNQIVLIPDSICKCAKLKRLWLDWNKIETLPADFLQLTSLESLLLTGNPMHLPEMSIIIEGVEAINLWFEEQVSMVKIHERISIVKALQKVLAYLIEHDIAPKSSLRQGIETDLTGDKDEDRFFGFLFTELFVSVLPLWQQHNEERLVRTNDYDHFRAFQYKEHEVWDALQPSTTDAYGPISVLDIDVLFEECTCTRDGVRRVCVPPTMGFMCKRTGCLLKERFVKKMEREDRDSLAHEAQEIQREKEEAKQVAETFCKSADGFRSFKTEALRLATEHIEGIRREKYVIVKLKELKDRKKKEETQGLQAGKRLEARKIRHLERLTVRERDYTLRLDALLPKWEKDILRNQLADVQDERENLAEDVELDFLKNQIEERKLSFAAREKLIKDGNGYKQRSERVRSIEVRLSSKHRRITQRYLQELINEYVIQEMNEAEIKVRREYKILRRIMKSWRMLEVRMTFNQWHDFATVQKGWRRQCARAEADQKELEEKSGIVEAQLLELERAKWILDVDPFSEKKMWTHCETQQVTFAEPVVECFVYRRPRQKATKR